MFAAITATSAGLHPIALLSGDLALNWSTEAPQIHLRTRTPIAHIQRSLQLRGVRLVELLPWPKSQPPQQKVTFPLDNVLNPPAPKPNSPIADGFFPHPPKSPLPDMPYEPLKAPK